ncbi:DUF4783 domain-containing protein [Hymenobacter sp. BT175]|uniref:DUF4783 domain-containing protein n=1 Tax=Hymenobacter translucens TaxID=2886507 RepID=UPI001D0DC971|nr:DUF4783 domain-containing protein [Hymenobacter translucens]MCC2545630.1 DUF4783 domain-containing protein [Hymenobacter translucens]
MKTNVFRVLAIVWLTLLSVVTYAQADAVGGIKGAIRSGSSRELSQYFGANVDLSFDGDSQSYSATQAEFVMKDFFAKNPPSECQFNHQGASDGGIQYVAGKYKGKGGSYEVFVKMKPAHGSLLIDTISFKKE